MTAPQPDVAGAVLALDQAMIALAVAKSTLLGETSRPMLIPGGGPDPYSPVITQADLDREREAAKHGRYDAASPAEVAEGVTSCSYRCGYTGHGADLADHEFTAHGYSLGHLPQHKGGHPECTAPGCGQPGHHLHAASIPSGGAA